MGGTASIRWRELREAAAAALVAAALLLAPIPSPPGDGGLLGRVHLDKLAHLLLFLALGWVWRRALLRAGRPVPYLAIFAVVVAYGGLLELLQGASGIRTAEWGDLAADALGAGLVPLWRFTPVQGATGGASEVASGAGGPDGAPVDSR